MMRDDTVVLYPGLGVSHLLPMLELSKLFLRHGLAVTVVVVEPPTSSNDTSSAVTRAAEANPSITFHLLPLPLPNTTTVQAPEPPPRDPFTLLRLANAPLRSYLRSMAPSTTVRAIIFDFFCIDVLDVAAELGVPAYLFYTSGASTLAISLHMPHKQAEVNASFGDLIAAADDNAPLLRFPGVPPFRPSDLPANALDRDNPVYRKFQRTFQRVPACRGMLVNSFEWLEPRAVAALRDDGKCVVPGRPTPPVYCVGPLVSGWAAGEAAVNNNNNNNNNECLAWLDAQPEKSVVFLCFGSMGSFPKKQLEAIAAGLETSGHRFLWVVRSPRPVGASLYADDGGDQMPEPELDKLLPEGFLERTRDRGLVAKSWAPQADVLRHGATGAFVTHCGWNSVLEGLTAGVPLLCWPLYAEQRLNKVFVVEEARVGVVMEGYDGEMVTAEEVEAKVRWVMDSEDGRALRLRGRAMAAKEMALEALQQGGTSHSALLELLGDLGLDGYATH